MNRFYVSTFRKVSTIIFFALLAACKPQADNGNLFEDVAESSGVHFANELSYTEDFNPYTYRSFFNGGGVALGDVNNDGLLDIYFTGNLVNNKLFLNKGNWEFEDITNEAGVACPDVWSSGATFADVNGDGWLDLYVCKSGKPGGYNRHNELFMNNGDLTFTEKSKEYGLDITGLSTHAAFFDYDKDGDLDCYVLTNSLKSIGGFDLIKDQREIPDATGGGNKFFRNDNGKFKDVTLESGIYASSIGFGLGITLSDFNKDGWTDVFISNDFFERDYLYINQRGQRFKESLEDYFTSISMGSMGADAADLNNDTEPDLFVTEMLPSTIGRKRTKAVYESWDKYQLNIRQGYFHQFPRNVLQQKVNDSLFVEVGRYSNVSATDWSWGALMFDANNDGLKDIFVANGIYKDLLDRDYLTYTANEQQIKTQLKQEGAVIKDLIDLMPSQAVPNQMFANLGDFEFENKSIEWGLGLPTFSNGSAYGDLDNDGDLDLVINNVNMPALVYKNNTDTGIHRFLQVKLVGEGSNKFGIGANAVAYAGNQVLSAENFPFRGFQSTVEPVIHFGLGDITKLDSVVVTWENGDQNRFRDIQANQVLTVFQSDANEGLGRSSINKNKYLVKSSVTIDFLHQENDFNDFDRDRLLPHMLHNEGPAMTTGDIDGDGVKELFIGGAKNQPAALFQYDDGGFKRLNTPVIANDSISEDVAAVFFDADGDDDLDLYVSSGGRAFSKSSSALNDRLYINTNGIFTKAEDFFFGEYFSSSSVSVLDYDNDTDLDLLITERFHPFRYGDKVRAFLMANDGKGHFTDVTEEWVPDLLETSMITDSKIGDFNGDGLPDILIASDWDNIRFFINSPSGFKEETQAWGLDNTSGWWHRLQLQDLDQDGDLDALAGNHGLNSFFKDSTRLYINDFDGNGAYDYIFCESLNGSFYPVADKNELISQLPILKKKLLYYRDYAKMKVEDIFSPEHLDASIVLDANMKTSVALINEGNSFIIKRLPGVLQYSPVYAFASADLDNDGFLETIVGGNQFLVKPQFGRYDALPLLVLDDNHSGSKLHISNSISQVRSIVVEQYDGKQFVIVANNNSKVEVYERQ